MTGSVGDPPESVLTKWPPARGYLTEKEETGFKSGSQQRDGAEF